MMDGPGPSSDATVVSGTGRDVNLAVDDFLLLRGWAVGDITLDAVDLAENGVYGVRGVLPGSSCDAPGDGPVPGPRKRFPVSALAESIWRPEVPFLEKGLLKASTP
jgi:hypothetical protein